MTFEIEFNHKNIQYQAVVTNNDEDLLVNLTSPAQVELAPTMALTMHKDHTLAYDDTMFADKEFMPAMVEAIKTHLEQHSPEMN